MELTILISEVSCQTGLQIAVLSAYIHGKSMFLFTQSKQI